MRGPWIAQSVKHLTSAQVTISRVVSSSPTSNSVLTAQSLEPASDSVSLSLCAPPLLSLCLSKINKHKKKRRMKESWQLKAMSDPEGKAQNSDRMLDYTAASTLTILDGTWY